MISRANHIQIMKPASTTKAIDGICRPRSRQITPSTSDQSSGSPASRRRLTS